MDGTFAARRLVLSITAAVKSTETIFQQFAAIFAKGLVPLFVTAIYSDHLRNYAFLFLDLHVLNS